MWKIFTRHGQPARPWELYFAIASGFTYFFSLASQFIFHAPPSGYLGFYLATYLLGGFFTVQEAYRSVREGRFEVDFLMLVAALGAATVGKFAEGAVLLFLFSLGHALEEYAMSRATKSINALASLAPRTATVKQADGQTAEVPVEQLQFGDKVIVRPNSRIPADGFLIIGNTSVDQSAVTGESIPVEKTAAPHFEGMERAVQPPKSAQVFAGTVNGAGSFTMMVTAAAEDSMLARVINLVQSAETADSPTARFVDRFQRYYVPVVLALVVAVFLIGFLALAEPFAGAFYRAMLVLVAASPCALAIATPSAVLAAIARAAQAGVLIKGAGPLELFGKLDVIAFDKTGTLTWGQPSVVSITTFEDVDPVRLRAVTLAVESLSDHPLAEAITHELAPLVPAQNRLKATHLVSISGQGVRAEVQDETALIGNLRLMEEQGAPLPPDLVEVVDTLQDDGQTTMVVYWAGKYLGVIGLMDQPRGESAPTIRVLREADLDQFVLLSGDNQQVAGAVGSQIGLDEAIGGLLPEDKVERVRALAKEGRRVGFVGDGVNDAPAMANASVGIAMGAAGSTVALETADIVLMSDDLGKLPFTRRLSLATVRTIHQNLIISLVIVALLVPASLFGLAMGPVVLIHEGSTLLVIFNALRLLRFEPGLDHHGIEHEERPARPTAKSEPPSKH